MAGYKDYVLEFKLGDGTMHSIPFRVPLGENGGYYTPTINQISETEIEIGYVPSMADMPTIKPAVIKIPDSGGNVDLTGYATEQWVQHYAQPKGDYALRNEIPTVPTKVSAFENDKGYLTQHQDISGKVNKNGLTLGIHSDGLVYVFVDGVPVGNGIEMGTNGDVFGYVDENGNIIVQGNLPDGTYSVKYEIEDGSTIDIGDLVLDSNVYYTVTNNLTNCVNSNSATEAIGGQSYSATITANSGYELSSVTVTMGGNPVTVTGGVIEIAEVTGDIVITAVAEEIKAAYNNILTSGDYTVELNKRWSASGKSYTACNGMICMHVPMADVKDKTIYFKGFTANGKSSNQDPMWFGLDASNARVGVIGGTDSGSGKIWTSTHLVDEGGGIYSIPLNESTMPSVTTAKTLCINMNVDTSAAITAIPDTCIMTIGEPIV